MGKTILVINGPNLNMLGTREPEIYGNETLADIEQLCQNTSKCFNLECDCKQSNQEGEIVNWIQDAASNHNGIIINAGAYSHTSIAIRDALLSVDIPIVEVHLSNIFKREEFRHHSYISATATGVICGLGSVGYKIAIEALAELI